MIGIGGTLDLISGHKVRAPRWMRRSGLEWTFRLAQEPKRLWRRYSRNIFTFFPQIARQWWAMRSSSPASAAIQFEDVQFINHAAVIPLKGSFSFDNVMAFEQIVQDVLLATPKVVLDCSKANFLDSTAFGSLVRLAHLARTFGGDLILAGEPENLAHSLYVLHLEKFFCSYPDLQSGLTAIQPNLPAENLAESTLYLERALIEV